MNRSIESRAHAGNRRCVSRKPLSIRLIAGSDGELDEIVKVASTRDHSRVTAHIDPEEDWPARLLDESVDILLLQQSLIAPDKFVTGGQPPETLLTGLGARFPALPIMVFGRHMDEVFVRRMIRLGVRGLIDSNTNSRELLAAAIDEVHDGGYWVTRKTLEKLIHSARSGGAGTGSVGHVRKGDCGPAVSLRTGREAAPRSTVQEIRRRQPLAADPESVSARLPVQQQHGQLSQAVTRTTRRHQTLAQDANPLG